MTTEEIIEEIRERFDRARSGAEESAKIAPGSWGSGYDLGYGDALGELLEHLTEEPVTRLLP